MSVGDWSHLGSKNPSSTVLSMSQNPLPCTLGQTPLQITHRGSSGTVTWSFSQVMMGAGSPSVWHSKRAVPFSSTVWDSGCREKSASAGDKHSEERVSAVCTVTQNTESRKHRAKQIQSKGHSWGGETGGQGRHSWGAERGGKKKKKITG